MKPLSLLLPGLLLALTLAGCSSSPSTPSNVVSMTNVGGSQFSPSSLAVAAGTTVTFKDVDGSHTVDFAEGTASVEGVSESHSGNLDPGQTFQVTFTKAGTYRYFCAYHSSVGGETRTGMVGTVTVT